MRQFGTDYGVGFGPALSSVKNLIDTTKFSDFQSRRSACFASYRYKPLNYWKPENNEFYIWFYACGAADAIVKEFSEKLKNIHLDILACHKFPYTMTGGVDRWGYRETYIHDLDDVIPEEHKQFSHMTIPIIKMSYDERYTIAARKHMNYVLAITLRNLNPYELHSYSSEKYIPGIGKNFFDERAAAIDAAFLAAKSKVNLTLTSSTNSGSSGHSTSVTPINEKVFMRMDDPDYVNFIMEKADLDRKDPSQDAFYTALKGLWELYDVPK